ncbi:Lrp/AsnC family transcriptional regulator [Streptomyces decoyicus]
MDTVDEQLMAELAKDGRASLTELAQATGRSPASITRRLGRLLTTGALHSASAMPPNTSASTCWSASGCQAHVGDVGLGAGKGGNHGAGVRGVGVEADVRVDGGWCHQGCSFCHIDMFPFVEDFGDLRPIFGIQQLQPITGCPTCLRAHRSRTWFV